MTRKGSLEAFMPSLIMVAKAGLTNTVFRKADGTYAFVLDRGYALHEGDGKPYRMLGSMQDVTQRRVFEATLKESEQRFRGTFENAAVGMAHVALDGKWLMVNERLCDIVGYARKELLSSTFQDITHPEDLGSDLELLQQTLDRK
jgi:PAS domain-containing protein